LSAGRPGSWSVKAHGWLRKFAIADDHEDANGDSVQTFWQALEKAKTLARVGEGSNSEAPITVLEALKDYEADLKLRGGAKYNATTLIRRHLPDALANKTVSLLKRRDLTEARGPDQEGPQAVQRQPLCEIHDFGAQPGGGQ
jgi:hypothetical protein